MVSLGMRPEVPRRWTYAGQFPCRVVMALLLCTGLCALAGAETVSVPYGMATLHLNLRDDAWILLPDGAPTAKADTLAALAAAGFTAESPRISPQVLWLEPDGSKAASNTLAALPENVRGRMLAVAGIDGVDARLDRWVAVTARISVRFNAVLNDPAAWLLDHGITSATPAPNLSHTWVGDAAGAPGTSLRVAAALRDLPEVASASPVLLRPMAKRFLPDDPLFGEQWPLNNTGTRFMAIAGNDANVLSAWDTYNGTGINIGIIDEGIDQEHPDLVANLVPALQLDVVDNDLDPSPEIGFTHGTSVAGVAAATGNNARGVCGVAFGAGLVGIRYVSELNTEETHAAALGHTTLAGAGAPHIDIFNMSYGPLDDGKALEAPGPLELDALATGFTLGRGGKGCVYAWAGGNGREAGDDANYDGYASGIYVIAVAASGADGQVSYYSEPGASIMLNAPSSYSTQGGTGVATTANGNLYTTSFGGTSAAAPVVAGVAALVLEANPELSARDVQHVLIESAHQNDPGAPSWITNGAGYHFSRDYGFGRVDASAAVALAPHFRPVPAWIPPLVATASVGVDIPDNDVEGITRTLHLDAPAGFLIERVVVRVSATHSFRGDLAWTLRSPEGTTVRLAGPRGDEGDTYDQWPFASLASWGERADGDWTLQVQDLGAADTGTLDAWSIAVYGYQIAHSADQNADHKIGLVELLRLIQFYNFGSFHCEEGTEDGYAPGPGDQTCAPHANDYAPQNWSISLGELLRLIQFYNTGGYLPCAGSEDGFCPGA